MDPTEAGYLAIATQQGLVPPSVGVDRACELVIANTAPDALVLELAGLVRPHPLDVVGILRRIAVGADTALVFQRVAALLKRLLVDDPGTLSRITFMLEQLALQGCIPDAAASECLGFDDARLLAEAGTYGTIEEVRRDLSEFLTRHEGPRTP
jgi:hypothetical protein